MTDRFFGENIIATDQVLKQLSEEETLAIIPFLSLKELEILTKLRAKRLEETFEKLGINLEGCE